MTFTLMDLPYDKSALEPHMSKETLEFHHGKHHRKYVDTLNQLVQGTPLESMELEHVIFESAFAPSGTKIFNNAAQVWNHDMFWKSMSPKGGGEPSDGDLAKRIDAAFGSFREFKSEFAAAATSLFGSGWAWLVADGKTLKITTTSNAILPLALRQHAIMACDVWEHAYYVDYRNDRAKFVAAFLDHLVDWDFVATELKHGFDADKYAAKGDREAVKRFLATGEVQKKAA
jgi:Fe-Mn family superoxide dismutase